MKRCMQYFYIGLMLSFQLTAQASIRDSGSISVDFNGLEHFKYSNGIVYVTLGRDGLKFFELSKPNNIEECSNKVVHCQLLGNSVNQLDIVGDYVYLLTDYGLEIVDSSRTQRVGALAINDTRKIVLQNDLAYIISGDKQVHIVDVSNTKSPKKLSTFESDLYGFDKIAVSDSYIYLTGTGVRYFFIVDVSNPASPKETIRYVTKETVSNLAVIGDYLYVIGSSASIFDVKTDPSNPKEIKLANPLYFSPLSNIIIQGKYAYFIGSDSLTIVDITNPKNPISKESYSFPNNTVYKVSVSGDYIYLADKTGLKKLKFNPVIIPCTYTISDSNPIVAAAVDLDYLSPQKGYESLWGYKLGKLSINTPVDENCEWVIKSDGDWLVINPVTGMKSANILYGIAPNQKRVERKAQLTITGKSNIAGQPDTTITIPVTQKAWGAFVSFDEMFITSTSPPDYYSVTYSRSSSKELNHYIDIFHSCGEINDTDFWVVLNLPESARSLLGLPQPWMYKLKANVPAEFDFKGFAFENRDKEMKPIQGLSFNLDYLDSDNKDEFCFAKWRLLPPLNSSILPVGVYTFYAVATKKGEDDELTSRIHYNPITLILNGDMSKIFSELAIFKLIITE